MKFAEAVSIREAKGPADAGETLWALQAGAAERLLLVSGDDRLVPPAGVRRGPVLQGALRIQPGAGAAPAQDRPRPAHLPQSRRLPVAPGVPGGPVQEPEPEHAPHPARRL